MTVPGKELSLAVRQGFEKACKEFTARVAAFGFVRSKRSYWIRSRHSRVEWIFLRRRGSSYGAPILAEINFEFQTGIRSHDETDFKSSILGPRDDPTRVRVGRYHLRFNAKSFSMYDKCLNDLLRFVEREVLPWFDSMQPA